MKARTKFEAVWYFTTHFHWNIDKVAEDRILDPKIIFDSGLEEYVTDDEVFVASETFPDIYFECTGKRFLRMVGPGKVAVIHEYNSDYNHHSKNVQYHYLRPVYTPDSYILPLSYPEGKKRYQPSISVHKQVGLIYGKRMIDREKHKNPNGTLKPLRFHHLNGIHNNDFKSTIALTDDIHKILEKVKEYRIWLGGKLRQISFQDLLLYSCCRQLEDFTDFVFSVYKKNVITNPESYKQELRISETWHVPRCHEFQGEKIWDTVPRLIELTFKKRDEKKKSTKITAEK